MYLHLIFGDQLNRKISSLSDLRQNEHIILMCEILSEATYVKHHKKKIAFVFSAMRHFSKELKDEGYNVHYTKLDCPNNSGSFRGEVSRMIKAHNVKGIIVTEPSDYRILTEIKKWKEEFGLLIEVRADDRFLCSHEEFAHWVRGRKQLRMEHFYRQMRRKYNILMLGKEPKGGKWNYDNENRKPPSKHLTIPKTFSAKPDNITSEVLKLVEVNFRDHFGHLKPFHYAVTRNQALRALKTFVSQRLKNYGEYQDAMLQDDAWMYHSHLSLYLNCGLLLPLECVQEVEQALKEKDIPLNSIEGFIRQIIGWREFMRGIYWLKMPEYEQQNFLNANQKLPSFFWTSETNMNCIKTCVKNTQDNAYAHHIQRLMVLGNFALLAGLRPTEVNDWFMVVYADAYQWVELPNVTGMALFADGGILSSKPYAASGSYINKMSDYCKNCYYNVNKKNTVEGCPFNYLYWDFLIRNKEKLHKNQRLSLAYKTLERMDLAKHNLIKKDAKVFFQRLNNGQKV